ncbi:hypothetical protein, partial [Sphingomonas sp.]|uniref:hypothetical protein n=1 Tax=Sphingomonas sp. TaxID=28214 RepID=UPI003D6C73A9
MRAIVFPNEDGDNAPQNISSIDDINQFRLNRVFIETSSTVINIEIHLIDWLVNLTNLINATGKTEIRNLMSFSGDTFSGKNLSDGSISLILWDIYIKKPFEVEFKTEEARYLHGVVQSYVQ